MAMSSKDAARIYHERSKHHLHRYARSPGHMDWATQPVPFRTFTGTKRYPLPFLTSDPVVPHQGLYNRQFSDNKPLAVATIAGILELSMGLSAWKSSGSSRWALRMNPSSGNLHPTECYLWTEGMDGLPMGLYHYHPLIHELEGRMAPDAVPWPAAVAHFATDGFLLGLTSIFWRESWKYGERAYRYCNLDAGHALAALSMAAGLFGWRVSMLSEAADGDIDAVLGLDRTPWHPQEAEHPDLLCWVHDARKPIGSRCLPASLVDAARQAKLHGTPEPLSPQRRLWDIIEETADGLRKPVTASAPARPDVTPDIIRHTTELSAGDIIRQRRSATAFNPSPLLARTRFLDILQKTLPREDRPPFDALDWAPRVHLLIFAHAVEGLTPGLYFLCRCANDLARIRNAATGGFSWRPIEEDLPLYRLASGDYRAEAIRASCHQEIAGFGAFSLGMIARFGDTITRAPHVYRQLYWECGIIGQVLYLEAEAQGVRGTGIGCYFDDEVHRIIGLEDGRYQSMYHFTVGTPVNDTRVETLPAYSHLDRDR